jgi:hypothetical protein
MQKQVKIVGLSIKEKFGILKATELTFDSENRLTVVKGEVGAGKSSLNKAMRLTTQGSNTLTDKTLYGDNVDIETQLVDGENKIFIGAKSKPDGSIDYVLYTIDANGKKVKEPVIDGVKATPASYLKSLQTALTWRLDELTSENPTTQRNILLELYSDELENEGVVFDKKHTKYVDGIIDKIEKAKEKRNLLDMKRKEVGGIADDLKSKGVDFSERLEFIDTTEIEDKISKLKAEITLSATNIQQVRESSLNALKAKGSEFLQKLRIENDKIIELNKPIEKTNEDNKKWNLESEMILKRIEKDLTSLSLNVFAVKNTIESIRGQFAVKKEDNQLHKLLEFNDKGSCISKPEDFEGDIKQLLLDYRQTAIDYKKLSETPIEKIDTSKQEKNLQTLETRLKDVQERNKEIKAVNAYHNWKEQNEEVLSLNKDYFMKLTKINTGVKGLYICPEYTVNEKGERIAKGNDIYMMYDGSYDSKYFNNPEKEIRKLASYSDTQKPVICLLIQNYLLSKKSKALPYLWIDQVPIDKKTRQLLEKMSEELGLWLFVNWTGDFDAESLKDGEILIENGEVFFNS